MVGSNWKPDKTRFLPSRVNYRLMFRFQRYWRDNPAPVENKSHFRILAWRRDLRDSPRRNCYSLLRGRSWCLHRNLMAVAAVPQTAVEVVVPLTAVEVVELLLRKQEVLTIRRRSR